MKAALPSLIIAGLLASGLVPTGASAREIKAKYTCNKGQSLKVVFKGDKATVTPKDGKTVTLHQALAADGFLYAKSKYSLRGRGDNATWTVGRHKPLNCYARR